MTADFDADAVEGRGWRQGSVLGPALQKAASDRAPGALAIGDEDWLIVTSHDCDVVNFSLEKEPFVEVLRAEVVERRAPDGMLGLGRNPRTLQLQVAGSDDAAVLRCRVHERWPIPRELLTTEDPAHQLDRATARLIAEWLAKRYIRAAFPGAFDLRWRPRMKDWTKLLRRNSSEIQGVYLRLNSLDELAEDQPYRCHLLLAVPEEMVGAEGWAETRDRLEREIEEFWGQFSPGIVCDGCEALGTHEVTLADLELYQRFDADWVSFADETDRVPIGADLTL